MWSRRAVAVLLASVLAIAGVGATDRPAIAQETSGAVSVAAGGYGAGLATRVAQRAFDIAIGGGKLLVADVPSGPGPIGAPWPVLVRAVDLGTSDERVIAGTGGGGAGGDGGPALTAQLNGPSGLAATSNGTLYLADSGNNEIRRIDPSGTITKLAGSGSAGYSGDGGPATAAALNWPKDVAVNAVGDVFVSDTNNYRVRRIDHATGIITTFAGNGTGGITGDGGPATAAQVSPFGAIGVDAAGNVYFNAANGAGYSVRRVDLSGTISTVASNRELLGVEPSGTLIVGNNGRIDTIDPVTRTETPLAGTGTYGYSGDGGAAIAAQIGGVTAAAVDDAGNIFLDDAANARVRRITNGIIDTFAGNGTLTYGGDGGPATDAQLAAPTGVACTPGGDLYIADTGNERIRRIDGKTGVISTVADATVLTESAREGANIGDLAVDAAGDVFYTVNNRTGIRRVDGATGERSTVSSSADAIAIAAAPDGASVYFVDPQELSVVDVATGSVTSVLGADEHTGTFQGVAVDMLGNVYVGAQNVVGRVDAATSDVYDVSEGGFAHGSISVDTAGNVFTPPSGDRDVAVCPSGDVFTSNGSDRVFRGAGAAASANFLRLAGADRVGTAIQGSWATFDDGEAGAVVLARSDAFPDALAGTPLAAAHHGPMLLTDPATLDDRVLDEISRVLPAGGDVYLLGGNAALAPGIAQALTTAGFRPVRLAGEDRFATAAVIAENGLGSPNSVLLATGSNFPDALAAGAAAASQHAAVLLSAGTSMPAPTSSYLSRHGARVVAIGGPAAAAAPGADKIVGSDRYDTARRVADRFFPQATLLGIASGLNFPDALAGGAVLGNQGGALLLSPPDALADSAAAYLDGRAAAVLLFGGRAALQDTVRRSAQAALAG